MVLRIGLVREKESKSWPAPRAIASIINADSNYEPQSQRSLDQEDKGANRPQGIYDEADRAGENCLKSGSTKPRWSETIDWQIEKETRGLVPFGLGDSGTDWWWCHWWGNWLHWSVSWKCSTCHGWFEQGPPFRQCAYSKNLHYNGLFWEKESRPVCPWK